MDNATRKIIEQKLEAELEQERYDKQARQITNYIEKAYDLNDLQGEGGAFGVWQKEIAAQIDKQTLKNLFITDDWVYIVVDLIANKLSSQPLQIMRDVKVGDEASVEEVHDHPLLAVFDRPNEYQDYHSWMYNQGVEDALMGNDIMWWDKKQRQLMILPSDQTNITFNDDGALDEYVVSVLNGDNTGIITAKRQMSFPVKEVIHIRRPNPKSLLWGLSPFLAGKAQLLFNRYTSDYLNAFYLKQATPGIALEMDREVKEEVALRQLKSFEQAYTGRTNQRRSLILPKGVTAKPLSHSLADQRLVDMIDKNRETILGLLKIPKHEIGLQASGSLGSEEHKIALRNFWEATMKPMMRRIAGTMTNFFQRQGELEPNEYIQFDLQDVPALQDDELKKAETAEKMAQTLSLNEVRARVWEEEPLSDPMADLPLSMMDKAQPPIPQQEAPVQDLEIEGQEDQIEDKALEVAFNKAGTTMEMFVKAIEDETAKSMNTYLDNTIDMIGDMAEIAINVVGRNTKATSEQEERLRKMREDLADEFGGMEDKFVKDHNGSLTATLDFGYDKQLALVFNQPNIDAVVALKTRTLSKARAVLEARGIESFASISKTQTEKIMREITKGVESGETNNQIQRRIANTFKDPESMMRRAATIARTETRFAVNQGQWAATQNFAEIEPKAKKVWLNLQDNRVRGHPSQKPKSADANHWKLHRQVRKWDKEFSNGLRFPLDPFGDADEVINCRCTWLLLPPDQPIPEGV